MEVNAPRPVIARRSYQTPCFARESTSRNQSDGRFQRPPDSRCQIESPFRPSAVRSKMSSREHAAATSSPCLVIKRSSSGRVSPKPEDTSSIAHDAHLLPFSVKSADGRRVPAPIDMYFRPYRRPVAAEAATDDGGPATLWYATFRGKPMTGLKVPMPDGYTGVLCSAVERAGGGGGMDLVADADRGQVIKDVMYWNWDKVPTDEDPLLAALRWTRLSEAMMSEDQ